MPEPLITTGAALVGAGAWFADKVFGPSAEAVGNQLKLYLSDRIRSVFERSAEIARERDIEISPVPPGLLARLVMDASFSSDDEEITEWWANLFLDASLCGSNLHAIYSEMMSKVGPKEAEFLKYFCEEFPLWDGSHKGDINNRFASLIDVLGDAILQWVKPLPVTEGRLPEVINNLTRGKVFWPIRPVIWSYAYQTSDGSIQATNQSNPWFHENLTVLSNLAQIGILDYNTYNVIDNGHYGWVKMVYQTPLGYNFYSACTGRKSENV